MTIDEMKKACEAMRDDRAQRDVAWREVEKHLAAANDAGRAVARTDLVAQTKEVSEDERATCARRGPLYRALGLAHLRLAREFAEASGVDVSTVVIPEE